MFNFSIFKPIFMQIDSEFNELHSVLWENPHPSRQHCLRLLAGALMYMKFWHKKTTTAHRKDLIYWTASRDDLLPASRV